MGAKIPIINMVFLFIAIQAMLVMINTHDIDKHATLSLDNINATNATQSNWLTFGYTSQAIWDVIISPQDGTGTGLYIFLGLMAAAIAVIAAIQRIDTGVWSGMFIILLGMGAAPIANFYNFINSETTKFACNATDIVCWPSEFVSMLVCGIIAFCWMWACIGWWSNRYD